MLLFIILVYKYLQVKFVLLIALVSR